MPYRGPSKGVVLIDPATEEGYVAGGTLEEEAGGPGDNGLNSGVGPHVVPFSSTGASELQLETLRLLNQQNTLLKGLIILLAEAYEIPGGPDAYITAFSRDLQ